MGQSAIEIGLTAAIITIARDDPAVFVVENGGVAPPRLPTGPFDPQAHRTFEIGLRAFVAEQGGFGLGYVEQLYTFGDRGRHRTRTDAGPHVVSVGYLALIGGVSGGGPRAATQAGFRSLYRFLPWEDWRGGRPGVLDATILPLLSDWAATEADDGEAAQRPLSRPQRIQLCFGAADEAFDDEKVLERYELLYEAGLVTEARRDGRPAALTRPEGLVLGQPMQFDHRRILATALGRLRGKLKYRPVVFELLPEAFTLTMLQKTVESISGHFVHTQNFRRFVENTQIVEPTGARTTTGGRPAALFRFRKDVMMERPAPGLRVGARG